MQLDHLREARHRGLEGLRESEIVKAMATWMPAAILAVLAASTLRSSTGTDGAHLLQAVATPSP